jgi:hypothetical protein
MKPLRADIGPAVYRGEVQDPDERAARGRQIAARADLAVETIAMQSGRPYSEDVVVSPALEVFAEATEPDRVIELVAVDGQDPRLGARQTLDESV